MCFDKTFQETSMRQMRIVVPSLIANLESINGFFSRIQFYF